MLLASTLHIHIRFHSRTHFFLPLQYFLEEICNTSTLTHGRINSSRMFSSVARSLARSTSTSLSRRSATTSCAPHRQLLTKASFNMLRDVSYPRVVHNHNDGCTKQVIRQPLLQQHAAAPVFVGFAVPASTVVNSVAADTSQSVSLLLDSILVNNDTAEEHPITAIASDEEGLQMKRNRNNRPAKRANKGKRPCNRNARRAKLIKIGRRSRS